MELSAQPRRVSSPSSGRSFTLPVGQEDYLAELREDLLATVDGDGRVVVIGGEAGIGKTTLVRQLAREAAEQGLQVLTGACYDLPNAPAYGPWLDVFGGVSRGYGLPEPPEAFSGGELRRITDQAALFGDVRGYFAELNQLRPVLLILEDLHWADPSSLDLLRDVARRASTMGVMIVVTYRTDDLTRKHPLYRSLPAIAREADARRIELRPLDREGLRELVAAWADLSRSDSDRLVAYLERHADGNPFFATELIRALKEKGLVAMNGERWELAKLDRVVVPPLLQQVIELRVSRLGDEIRTTLAIAAVIGQDVPLSLWSAVAGLEKYELFDTVDQAIDAHLLEADDGRTVVRFVHALTRDALYDSILPFRRSAWHGQVADALLATQRPEPDAVAHHLQMAGDSRAWQWLVEAGTRAQDAYAWVTAIDRYRAAVELLLAEASSDTRTAGILLCRLAFIQRFSDPAGATGDVERVLQLPGWTDDLTMKGEAIWALGTLLHYSNHSRSGNALMHAGVDILERRPSDATLPPLTMKRLIAGTLLASFVPELRTPDEPALDTSATPSQDVVEGLRHINDWHCVATGELKTRLERLKHTVSSNAGIDCESFVVSAPWVYLGLGFAYAGLGYPDASLSAFDESRRRFRDVSHHALVAISLFIESADWASTYGIADPELRRTLAAECEAALFGARGALRSGLSTRIAWLRCMVLDGQWHEAGRILEDTPCPGNAYFWRDVRLATALLARYRGNLEAAWREIHPLFPEGPETEPGDITILEGLELQRLAVDLCIDAGDLTGAHRWLAAHDDWLEWSGALLGVAGGELGWARLFLAEGDIEVAGARAEQSLELATDLDQPLVRLHAHRLQGAIALAGDRFQDGEGFLRKALDLATICQMPFERALVLLPLADCYIRIGRQEDAAALVDEASACFATLEAFPALERANKLATRLGRSEQSPPLSSILTGREMEVLQLVVTGQTNQSIADQLFISRETARTHVSNIFRKLGVGSRAEAVDAAHRRNLVRLEGP